MSGLVRSAPSIPHQKEQLLRDANTSTESVWGGGAEPTRSLSPELLLALMGWQRAWAKVHAPHLLEEWLNA